MQEINSDEIYELIIERDSPAVKWEKLCKELKYQTKQQYKDFDESDRYEIFGIYFDKLIKKLKDGGSEKIIYLKPFAINVIKNAGADFIKKKNTFFLPIPEKKPDLEDDEINKDDFFAHFSADFSSDQDQKDKQLPKIVYSNSIIEILDESKDEGKRFKSFLKDDHLFKILDIEINHIYEVEDKKSKLLQFNNSQSKIEYLAKQGINLTTDSYDKKVGVGKAKLKVYLFQERPVLLGGISHITQKLHKIWPQIINNNFTKEELSTWEAWVNKLPIDFENEFYDKIWNSNQIIDDLRLFFVRLPTEHFGNAEKDILQKIRDFLFLKKVTFSDLIFFENILKKPPPPHGTKEQFKSLCEKLIPYFSIILESKSPDIWEKIQDSKNISKKNSSKASDFNS